MSILDALDDMRAGQLVVIVVDQYRDAADLMHDMTRASPGIGETWYFTLGRQSIHHDSGGSIRFISRRSSAGRGLSPTVLYSYVPADGDDDLCVLASTADKVVWL